MSQWRLDVRRLHKLGGVSTTNRIDNGGYADPTQGLKRARELGLVTGGGRCGRATTATWRLTPLGEAWVLGRVEERGSRSGGVKTWFAPVAACPTSTSTHQLEMT